MGLQAIPPTMTISDSVPPLPHGWECRLNEGERVAKPCEQAGIDELFVQYGAR